MLKEFLLLAIPAVLALSAPRPPTPGVTLTRVPNNGLQPQTVRDGSGMIHLLYFKGNPAHGDLFYVKSADDAHTWSTPLRVNSQPGAAVALGTIRGGQLALGKAGRVHVAWNGSNDTSAIGPVNRETQQRGMPMLYSRLNDSGTAFEPERNLMTHTFGLDGGGAIAADSDGHVYVVWHGKASGDPAGEVGRQVWITISEDDGKTFTAEHAAWNGSTGACGCCGMAINADRNGHVRILYRSATANVHRDIYLLTSSDHGHTFEGRKLQNWDINACPMSSMAFGASPGKVEGAWENAGQVYFTNASAPTAAPGEGKGRKHPRITIDRSGRTLMTWTEGTGWARGGSIAWQLFDPNGSPVGNAGSIPGLPAWSFSSVVTRSGGFIVMY